MSIVTIERKVLEKNDAVAAINRDALVRQGVFTINMVSSPGAGKTTLLERIIAHLDGALRLAVVEGDVQTDLDAQRVAKYGVPVVQIVTNGGCHLEARLVQDALSRLDLATTDVLVIENVGNLVCPANFDLGEDLKVVVLSVTEGDDKPLKYPAMFQRASVLIINKVDLVPYVDADVSAIRRHARLVNPDLQIFETSCRSGVGIAEWAGWLAAQAGRRRG
jgi:hydrogenase nickel incorporation protein HypB